MTRWQIWQEIRLLLEERSLSSSLREEFELVAEDLERVLDEFKDSDEQEHASLQQEVSLGELSRELKADSDTTSMFDDMSLEGRRCEAVISRIRELRSPFGDVHIDGKWKQVLRRLESFVVVRWWHFRRRSVYDRHLSPEEAQRMKDVDDGSPDIRNTWADIRKIDGQSPDGMTHEDIVERLIQCQAPIIRQNEERVVIFSPALNCTLHFQGEEQANSAVRILQRRFKKDTPAARKLREEPAVMTAIAFLSKALPDNIVPWRVVVEQHQLGCE